jgi:hypothetical protein
MVQLKKICSWLIISQIQDVAAIYNLVDDQQSQRNFFCDLEHQQMLSVHFCTWSHDLAYIQTIAHAHPELYKCALVTNSFI